MAARAPAARRNHHNDDHESGLIGGVVAGITFALFEMIASALLMGLPAFFMPLRSISGIVLGMQALDPSFSLVTAAIVGMLTHMMLFR